jgi:hypothetical protein
MVKTHSTRWLGMNHHGLLRPQSVVVSTDLPILGFGKRIFLVFVFSLFGFHVSTSGFSIE